MTLCTMAMHSSQRNRAFAVGYGRAQIAQLCAALSGSARAQLQCISAALRAHSAGASATLGNQLAIARPAAEMRTCAALRRYPARVQKDSRTVQPM